MKSTPVLMHHRQRKCDTADPYPHPDPRVQFLDKLIIGVAIVYPLTTVPQIYTIWVNHNAGGVSLLTWTLYFILSIPFLIYGIVHKQKPLIIMYTLWILVYAGVISGALVYG